MNKEVKQTIKTKIENYEYYHNAMNYQCGTYTEATNIKITDKNSCYFVTAKVKLVWQLDGRTETYSDCEYFMAKEDCHLLTRNEYEQLIKEE